MDIQKRTIKRLRTAASKFFPDDEAYHVWIGYEYGVDSTLELTDEQGKEAAKAVNEMKRARSKKREARRPGGITVAQQGYIEGLFAECGIPRGKRQRGFIRKQTGKTKPAEWLTNREASKVITGLKRFSAGRARTKKE